jgi:hypothetical protein
MTASLQAAPGKQPLALPAYSDGCPPPSNVCNAGLAAWEKRSGPSCSVSGYRSLSAGTVTMQGASLSPL